MLKHATFAFAATIAAFAATTSTAAPGGTASGDWCNTGTKAQTAEIMHEPEAAETTISLVLSDPGGSLGDTALSQGYRLLAGAGTAPPIDVVYVFGDTAAYDAPGAPVRRLSSARNRLLPGSSSEAGAFSLRSAFDTVRALRDCAGV